MFPLNLTRLLAGQFGTRTEVILHLVILASIPCTKLCMLVASLPEYRRACKGRAAITRTAKHMSVKEGLISNEDQTSQDSDRDRDNSNKDRMFNCRLTTVPFSCRLTTVPFSCRLTTVLFSAVQCCSDADSRVPQATQTVIQSPLTSVRSPMKTSGGFMTSETLCQSPDICVALSIVISIE